MDEGDRSLLQQSSHPTIQSSVLDKLVDEIFQEFLPAADVRVGLALLEHVSFEFLEAGLARLDLRADAGIPRSVAVLDKFAQPSVFADGGGDLQAAREGVHATDVRIKQINRLETFAAHLGVEIRAAGLETAVFEDGEHDLRGQIHAGRKLVGVPADQFVDRKS